MKRILHIVFGAVAQVIVGVLLLAATLAQTVYWLWITPPNVKTVFIVSMEALAFASYAIIATGFAVIWLDARTPDAEAPV